MILLVPLVARSESLDRKGRLVQRNQCVWGGGGGSIFGSRDESAMPRNAMSRGLAAVLLWDIRHIRHWDIAGHINMHCYASLLARYVN